MKREKKQFSINERKRIESLQKPDCHSESFLTGNIPPHMNKEEKTETPSFLSKNADLEKILLVRDRTFDL